MTQYRQGDILFVRVDKLPNRVKTKKDNIVAEGEATGHAHRVVDGILFERAINTRPRRTELFVEALGETKIKHEEHAEIALPTGIYRVVRQREYSETGTLTVFD